MTQRLPLFDDDEDRRSIQPKTMKDDVEFRKQRRRNRKKATPLPPPPVEGPCCLRCANWHAPRFDDEEYGECGVLHVAMERAPAYGIEKGEVHDRVTLWKAGLAGEPLRTGPGFACYAYQTLKGDAA